MIGETRRYDFGMVRSGPEALSHMGLVRTGDLVVVRSQNEGLEQWS